MRVALLSPYSWTYPGGVARHVEALARQLRADGHEARVLAPFDPPGGLAARAHAGARPQEREVPDWLVPLGRTVGIPANGAVSNLSFSPWAVAALRRELAHGGYDVVHVHEPIAPLLCWDVLAHSALPLVGTFHCYSANALTNNLGNLAGARRRLNHLRVRIAVSEAAAWTGRRFFGGRYRVVPNGVDVPAAVPGPRTRDGELRIAFVGQAVERKGLPVLLRAFEALREQVPARLTIVGATEEDVAPLLLGERAGIEILGRVDDAAREAAVRDADVVAAPSLGGESFGMVLTEAFAQGRPVVASDIAGYRNVVRHDREGLLVPRGDAVALAHALRDLALDPGRRERLAAGAAQAAPRFAWPTVAREVAGAYADAIAVPVPRGRIARAAVRRGLAPADALPPVPAQRVPSLEPAPPRRSRVRAVARRAALGLGALGGAWLSVIAVQRIGLDRTAESLVRASQPWVLAALALMCASMAVRAVSWHAILRAAVPESRPRLIDALRGTMIGVLMSATLPARLGEPARAMIVSRRLSTTRTRARELLPTVLGTIVSQTLLNVLALVILGAVTLGSINVFDGRGGGLWLFTVLPVAVVVVSVLAAPALVRTGRVRSRRASAVLRRVRDALVSVRAGLRVFGRPQLAVTAVAAQLLAWVVQWLSCYLLLVAFGLDDRAGMGAAAAVLFAVNVSAVLPATPSNVGVFQAACVFVLAGAYGVSSADALGYGIVLQAVEVATAFVMGVPALLAEGVTWRDVRLRALHAAPVQLPPLPASARVGHVPRG
jgi:phosphatidylinositol alpha-mannosyltransferase